jgi:hypothetical protein
MSSSKPAYEIWDSPDAAPIHDMTGVWPAESLPRNETATLLEAVRSADAEIALSAELHIIALRLPWVYNSFAKRESLQQRTDLEPEDIMQIGCLATIEAIARIDFSSPTQPRQQLVNQQEREAERWVARTRLVPLEDEKTNQPFYDGFHLPFAQRAIEPLELPGNAMAQIIDGQTTQTPSIENDIYRSATFQAGLLRRLLAVLTADELAVVQERFLEDDTKTLGEIAQQSQTSRVDVRRTEYGALRKMYDTIPAENIPTFRALLPEDLTNYGLGLT